jgi:hypothetical protein
MVCPIGKDRELYGSSSVTKEGVAHCQNFGSKNAARRDGGSVQA